MKYTFGLLLIFIFCTACKRQNKTDQSTDTTNSKTKDTVISYGPSSVVRTIKQDRKGNIWITSWEGDFRYGWKIFYPYHPYSKFS